MPSRLKLKTDSGETLGLDPNRLTLTFGFGAPLFEKDGKDRYGLKAKRPEALIELPYFNGDQLVEGHTGGDLSVQACATLEEGIAWGNRNVYGLCAGLYSENPQEVDRFLKRAEAGVLYVNRQTGATTGARQP